MMVCGEISGKGEEKERGRSSRKRMRDHFVP